VAPAFFVRPCIESLQVPRNQVFWLKKAVLSRTSRPRAAWVNSFLGNVKFSKNQIFRFFYFWTDLKKDHTSPSSSKSFSKSVPGHRFVSIFAHRPRTAKSSEFPQNKAILLSDTPPRGGQNHCFLAFVSRFDFPVRRLEPSVVRRGASLEKVCTCTDCSHIHQIFPGKCCDFRVFLEKF